MLTQAVAGAITSELSIPAAWELKHLPEGPGQDGQVWLIRHAVMGLYRPASVSLAESEETVDSIVGGPESWGPCFLL